MLKDEIRFRGITDGVYLEAEGEFDNLLKILDDKVRKRLSFYKGTALLDIRSDSLSKRELLELGFLLKHRYGFIVEDQVLDEILGREAPEDQPIKDDRKEIKEQMTKYVNRTIRSGQSIDYDGSVVIIGDVNPGAIISARDNIIILGSFRGVAHAGKDGDSSAVVAAYKLNPMQLRIADKIARAPDKKPRARLGGTTPEIARIIDDKLIIEPYLPNK